MELRVHDLRDHTDDRHRSVDDAPFGGGPGMVMKAEPFFRAVEAIRREGPAASEAVVLLSPRGRRFDQEAARRSRASTGWCCSAAATRGSTSGWREALATEELSLGDFVLTGGETAALAVVEAAVRLLPGALGDEGSAESDSFEGGLLDWPHYTRPGLVARPDGARGAALGRPRAHPPLAAARRPFARRASGGPTCWRPRALGAEDEALLREIEDEARAGGPGALDKRPVVIHK